MKRTNRELLSYFTIILSIGVPTQLWASAPQKYNSCNKQVKVREPSKSGGYWFSSDCKTIYIEPAVYSKMQVTAFAPLLGVEECKVIELFKKSYLQEAKNIEVLSQRAGIKPEVIKAKEKQISINIQKIAKIQKQVSDLVPYETVFLQKKEQLSQKKTEIETQMLTNNSSSLVRELRSVEEELKEVNEKLSKITLVKTQLTSQITQLESQNTFLNSEITTMLAGNPEIQIRREALEKTLMTHIENFGNKKGATAQVMFANSQTELLNEFRRMNPSLQVERLPVQIALSFSVKTLGDMNLPASIGSPAIPGVTAKFIGDGVTPSEDSVFFGNSISGQVDLSMIGACEVLKSGTTNSHVLNTQASALLIANATYQYHLQSGFGYNISYSLSEVMKKISESKTKGGFFSSSSTRKLVESADFKEVVKVKVYSTDPLLNDQLEQMAQDVRTEVLTRALNMVSKSYVYFDSKAGLEMGQAPQPGAPVLANGVRKTCPHLYCQIGAFALDIAHAIFGSTSQRDEYLRTINQEIREDYQVERMLPYYGTFTFKNSN